MVGDVMNSVEETIINSAIKLFSEKGYAATSIRDIAKSVNMTSASLYHYMNTKKDLLNLIMKSYLSRLFSGAESALTELNEVTADKKLETLIRFHVQSHGKEKLAALVVDTEYRSLEGKSKEEIKKLRNNYEKLWTVVLEEGQKNGDFYFSDIKITSFALISLCTGVAHWYRDNGRLSLEEIANQYSKLGLQMVKFT